MLPRPADGQNAFQSALQFAENAADNERLDDEGGGLLSGVNPRISLMQKLQRVEGQTTTSPISPNICLEPLYTAEDVAQDGPSLLDDIEEDVRSECAKYGTVLRVSIAVMSPLID